MQVESNGKYFLETFTSFCNLQIENRKISDIKLNATFYL